MATTEPTLLVAERNAGLYDYGERTSGEVHGVVLTKPHVVELILDLTGYVETRDLGAVRLLEPACGHGAFLVAAVERLVASAKAHGRSVADLSGAIRAFDIDQAHVQATREAIMRVLVAHGLSARVAARLVATWVQQGDFLLTEHEHAYDAVVGNPPYVRIEQLDARLQGEYRARYRSLFDRADLYVAFIERSLDLLSDNGVLSFICADRWTNNRYGKVLRKKIATGFKVHWYVDLNHASPFESEVIAYPAIFAIGRGTTETVKVARMRTADAAECRSLRRKLDVENAAGVEIHGPWFSGEDPWVLASQEQVVALRELEARCRPIEDVGGTRVGIGVASGADDVYIVDRSEDIEPDRLVPLVMRDGIVAGQLRDGGRCIINTFADGAGVVDLDQYPRLARYLDRHAAKIKGRHVAKSNPSRWFRTIDRVYPELVKKPKLLIPDIAGSNEVAYDEGRFHPHHNLYYVTSEAWDLEVLGGLLCSRVALFFVWSYAVKMRGNYLRFQAQYLRRIRLPEPESLAPKLADQIRQAFRARDFKALDRLALKAYKVDRLPDFDFVDTRT